MSHLKTQIHTHTHTHIYAPRPLKNPLYKIRAPSPSTFTTRGANHRQPTPPTTTICPTHIQAVPFLSFFSFIPSGAGPTFAAGGFPVLFVCVCVCVWFCRCAVPLLFLIIISHRDTHTYKDLLLLPSLLDGVEGGEAAHGIGVCVCVCCDLGVCVYMCVCMRVKCEWNEEGKRTRRMRKK